MRERVEATLLGALRRRKERGRANGPDAAGGCRDRGCVRAEDRRLGLGRLGLREGRAQTRRGRLQRRLGLDQLREVDRDADELMRDVLLAAVERDQPRAQAPRGGRRRDLLQLLPQHGQAVGRDAQARSRLACADGASASER